MRTLRCGSRHLILDQCQVMGVLNITPDSFSDGGSLLQRGKPDIVRIQETAQRMMAEGAALLDVGGESTRPGAEKVSVQQELQRVMPVLESLLSLDTIVSVDTRKPEVAFEALAVGAHMINDVNALRAPGMLDVLAASDAAACLMHMQGRPESMQRKPEYRDVVGEVRDFLAVRTRACCEAGVDAERLILDPGFGFGKTLEHNLSLLSRLNQCRVEDYPLLVGLSRKSMIGALTGRKKTGERLGGSLSAAVIASFGGADIIRTHDVAATVDALAVAQRIRRHQKEMAD